MVGEVLEVEALIKELLPGLFNHLFFAKQGLKYAAVFNECIIDVSDDGTVGGLELIVISVATIIVAEFLVCSSM